MSDKKYNLYLDTVKLLELRETDYDAFIDKLYTTIVADPDLAVEDEHPSKVDALNTLITYYEKSEEYERCQKLYEIRERINEQDT